MNASPKQLPDLLTPDEVADALRVSAETVHRWCRDNQIEYIDINGRRRFRREYIEALLAPIPGKHDAAVSAA